MSNAAKKSKVQKIRHIKGWMISHLCGADFGFNQGGRFVWEMGDSLRCREESPWKPRKLPEAKKGDIWSSPQQNRPGIPKKRNDGNDGIPVFHHFSGVFCLVLVSGWLLSFWLWDIAAWIAMKYTSLQEQTSYLCGKWNSCYTILKHNRETTWNSFAAKEWQQQAKFWFWIVTSFSGILKILILTKQYILVVYT